MRKKIAVLIAVSAAAMALGGCVSGSTGISSSVAEADPWEEMESLSAAEEAVGFEIEVPDMSDYGPGEAYRVCAALSEIEIQYLQDDEQSAYIRKAKDNGDISGDYNEYEYEAEKEVGDYSVTYKGESEDAISLCVWNTGDYAYCVGFSEAVSADVMDGIVSEIN